jgi:hypothetical protein
MFATGIGLVIEGIERYERELTRDRGEVKENKEVSNDEDKISRKPRATGFLKMIQDWFEKDAEE